MYAPLAEICSIRSSAVNTSSASLRAAKRTRRPQCDRLHRVALARRWNHVQVVAGQRAEEVWANAPAAAHHASSGTTNG